MHGGIVTLNRDVDFDVDLLEDIDWENDVTDDEAIAIVKEIRYQHPKAINHLLAGFKYDSKRDFSQLSNEHKAEYFSMLWDTLFDTEKEFIKQKLGL